MQASRTVRSLLRLFGRGRGQWYLMAVLVAATSVMEAVAAALVFALVNALSTGGVSLPLLGAVTPEGGGLRLFALVVAGVFLLRAALVIAHNRVLYRLCYGSGAELEERLLHGYLALPPRELRRRGHAELVRNVHDTVMSVVEECLIPCVLAVGSILSTVAIVAVMLRVALVPTLLAGLVFGPLLYLIARTVRRPVRRLGEQVEVALASSLRSAVETLNLAHDIRTAGRSAAFAARYGGVRRQLARAGGTEEVIRSVPRLAAETVLVLFVVTYVAVATAEGGGTEVLPTLGLFAYAALRLLPSLVGLVGLAHSIAQAGPALETILADEPLLHVDRAEAVAGPAPATLSLDSVTVRIPGTDHVVLRDVDLHLRRGDVVALVGPNGAGKSTLIDVLAGLLPPDSGSVTADGRSVLDGGGWPAQVAMVPQHVHLLDADVATNITLDPSTGGPTGAELAGVIEDVGLGAVVARLQGGTVGEDGRLLSGGERQRVAVARALHRSASVLLVDEGSSALDTAARSALARLVTEGREERIAVLVTHDAELARACTRVVRVEGGRVQVQEPVPPQQHR